MPDPGLPFWRTFVVPILQMKKVRLREVKALPAITDCGRTRHQSQAFWM